MIFYLLYTSFAFKFWKISTHLVVDNRSNQTWGHLYMSHWYYLVSYIPRSHTHRHTTLLLSILMIRVLHSYQNVHIAYRILRNVICHVCYLCMQKYNFCLCRIFHNKVSIFSPSLWAPFNCNVLTICPRNPGGYRCLIARRAAIKE